MVQRKKLFLDVMSHGTKPETRFSNLTASQELRKKKMKRTRPTRLKDAVSTPGKPPPVLDHEMKTKTTMMTPSPQKQSAAKVTDGSPNYMKGTTSSEARRESVPRNVRVGSGMEILRGKKKTGTKLSGSGSGIEKQSKGLCRNSSLKMTKTPSFKRCSRIGRCSDVNVQRATCSSTLKDSKFPEYLMLSPGGTEAEGTSVFKVCPYTYCSLNGHLHAQYPPLKSFISARRRALKSQRGGKMEASSSRKENPPNLAGKEIVSLDKQEKCADGFVEIYVAKNRELEQENGLCSEGDGQVSESLSDGAPRSEIDSEESFGFYNDVFATNKGPNESFVAEEGEEEYPPLWSEAEASKTGTFEEIESEGVSEIIDMEWEGDYFKKPGVGSDCAEIVNILEVDGIESKGTDSSDGQETLVGAAGNNDNARSGCCDFDAENMPDNQAVLEQSENASEDSFHLSDDAIKKTAEGKENQDPEASSLGISINFLWSDENIIQPDEAPETEDVGLELNDHMPYTLDDSLSLEAKGDAADVDTDESDKDVTEDMEPRHLLGGKPDKQAQDYQELDKVKVYRFGLTEEAQEIGKVKEQSGPDSATDEIFPLSKSKNIHGEKTEKIAFTRGCKSTKQGQPVDFSEWIIKYKRNVEDVKDLRAFNPREPNYLPVVPEPDAEKVDLKHQDIDERKNTEEWMIDYALQRVVSKLAPARKKKVALLVEAFETVMPVPKCQSHAKETSAAFTCGMPLQACN